MRIVSVVGARPQFVKLAPLSRRLRERHEEVIVHTGQHYGASMSDRFFEELGIPPVDVNLGIGSAPHGVQTGAMLAALEGVLVDLRPELVIVFGDTNSTLAGALAAAKLGIRSVHVEAGLRSFNRSMPEEVNRVVADHTADLLFAPTRTAVDNLGREGLEERVHLTGDLMADALEENVVRSTRLASTRKALGFEPGEYLLLTLHRPYNVDDPERLGQILKGVGTLGHPVVFPAHPRTRAVIDHHGVRIPPSVRLLPPLGYLDILDLQANAHRILTDSGGMQKEAYLLGVPCITLRPETEWVETVADGWNLLVEPCAEDFSAQVEGFQPAGRRTAVFGENVSRRMLEIIDSLDGGSPPLRAALPECAAGVASQEPS